MATTRLLTVVAYYDDALAPPNEVYAWTGEPITIGRGDPSGLNNGKLSVADPRVSTAHAELKVDRGSVVLRDLGSSNGTFVDGVRAQGPTLVDDGALIELGRTALVYRAATPTRAQSVLPDKNEKAGARLGQLTTLNPELGELFTRLLKVATTDQPALLVGETGTGKDVLAHEVHALSGRKGELVAVDCGAIPDNLFESTMFGHEKGAFTGATEPREGEIVRAHRGTLFLDEVGNLSPSGQAKLLRALETSVVTPLGSSKSEKVDVRWLAATNRLVLGEDDGFRSDLLHRLAGFVVTLPPLRQRREDLGLLIAALLVKAGVKKAKLTPAAARMLLNHPLPGNARQLRNVINRAATAGDDVTIDEDALGALEIDGGPKPPRATPAQPNDTPNERMPPLRAKQPGKEELEAVLIRAGGVVSEAARALGTSPRQLYRWLEKVGLDPDAFRKS
ncbi:MAG: sigma 54-interacting transcriptional regulator [Myxococcaceae bacterium]